MTADLARTTTTPSRILGGVAWAAAGAGVLIQIAFPLTGGGTLALTIASVVCFALAAVTHAAASRGVVTAVAVLLVAGLGGMLAEAVGVKTGFPFGEYDYAGTLGPQLLDVPVVVPLAWLTLAYPSAIVARRLLGVGGGWRRIARIGVGAWALTAWDVFLDPQMVEAGHWGWANPEPGLPGVPGIPLTNFAGWLLVAAIMVALIDLAVSASDRRLGRRTATADRVPLAVWLWTFGSSVLANAAFFGRPSVALTGGIIMSVVGIPLIVRLVRDARASRTP